MRSSSIWRNLIYAFLALALILIVVQIIAAWQMQSITTGATRGAQSAGQKDVALQKAREDLISAQIGNESKNALETFASQFGALTATLVTLSGAILAFRSYLDAREKEQKDRFESQETERRDRAEAREKERQDRLAISLSETLSRLVGDEPRERIVGAAGLFPFFRRIIPVLRGGPSRLSSAVADGADRGGARGRRKARGAARRASRGRARLP
jgi:hypothetical protein